MGAHCAPLQRLCTTPADFQGHRLQCWEQLLHRHSGRLLLRPLFAAAGPLPHHGAVEPNLHLELFGMVRAGFAGEFVLDDLILLFCWTSSWSWVL